MIFGISFIPLNIVNLYLFISLFYNERLKTNQTKKYFDQINSMSIFKIVFRYMLWHMFS